MAKNSKFAGFAALIRSKDNKNVCLTRWDNISFLRYRRRTNSNFTSCKIKRVPIDDAVTFIFNTYGENQTIKNYENLGFHKFFNEELKRLQKRFDYVNSAGYNLSDSQVLENYPTWFVEFVKTFKIRDYDTGAAWRSYNKFIDVFYYAKNYLFTDHPSVTTFFYNRFEQSLAGTLAADYIPYIDAKVASKKMKNTISTLDDYIKINHGLDAWGNIYLNRISQVERNRVSFNNPFESSSYWTTSFNSNDYGYVETAEENV